MKSLSEIEQVLVKLPQSHRRLCGGCTLPRPEGWCACIGCVVYMLDESEFLTYYTWYYRQRLLNLLQWR